MEQVKIKLLKQGARQRCPQTADEAIEQAARKYDNELKQASEAFSRQLDQQCIEKHDWELHLSDIEHAFRAGAEWQWLHTTIKTK